MFTVNKTIILAALALSGASAANAQLRGNTRRVQSLRGPPLPEIGEERVGRASPPQVFDAELNTYYYSDGYCCVDGLFRGCFSPLDQQRGVSFCAERKPVTGGFGGYEEWTIYQDGSCGAHDYIILYSADLPQECIDGYRLRYGDLPEIFEPPEEPPFEPPVIVEDHVTTYWYADGFCCTDGYIRDCFSPEEQMEGMSVCAERTPVVGGFGGFEEWTIHEDGSCGSHDYILPRSADLPQECIDGHRLRYGGIDEPPVIREDITTYWYSDSYCCTDGFIRDCFSPEEQEAAASLCAERTPVAGGFGGYSEWTIYEDGSCGQYDYVLPAVADLPQECIDGHTLRYGPKHLVDGF